MTLENLNNFELVELSSAEAKEIEGGFWLELLALTIGIVVGLFVESRVYES